MLAEHFILCFVFLGYFFYFIVVPFCVKFEPIIGNFMHTAPPVREDVSSDCAGQARRSKHIMCAEDGSFEPVQCMGRKCYCVNNATGERLRPVDHKNRDCSGGEKPE